MSTLRAHESCVLVIDMQTGLLPAILDHDTVLTRARLLAQAAGLLDVPVLGTEHWADKIGPTDASIRGLIDRIIPKTHFDATREVEFHEALPVGRHKVLLIGTEAHVCVLQTGLGLADMGYTPILITDGIGSRKADDKAAALSRWVHRGLEVISSEMALFEWMETPAHPAFRDVLGLIKSS